LETLEASVFRDVVAGKVSKKLCQVEMSSLTIKMLFQRGVISKVTGEQDAFRQVVTVRLEQLLDESSLCFGNLDWDIRLAGRQLYQSSAEARRVKTRGSVLFYWSARFFVPLDELV
jgi:hypothetical protein